MLHDKGRHVSAVAFTADGKQAAIGARDGSVRIYEMETRQMQAGGDWFLFERGVGVDAWPTAPRQGAGRGRRRTAR